MCAFGCILIFLATSSCTALHLECDALDLSCNPLLGKILYATPGAGVCSASPFDLTLPDAWPRVQAELRRQAAKGNYGAPVATLFGPNPGVGSAYAGGVLAPNGKIYAIPHSATSVAVIDPQTNTVSTFGNLVGGTKWVGGVLAPNGKIYAIPFGATTTTVLEIDPETNTTQEFGALPATASKWSGAVLASSGLIYAAPVTAGNVLVVDPVLRTTTTTGVLNTQSSAVLASTGNVYSVPGGSGSPFAVISTFDSSITTIGNAPAVATPYLGGAIAPNGKIYALPTTGSAYAEIDPVSNAIVNFGTGSGFVSGVLAADGKIYGIPNGSGGTYVAVDPDALVATTFGSIAGGNLYQSGVLAPNGKIYGIPFDAGSYLEIDPRANGSICHAILLSSYLNKF